jgi:hypothetical protein
MNCKPGDLAILVRARRKSLQPLVGQIHRCHEVTHPPGCEPHWRFDPPLRLPSGEKVAWGDSSLRPIRDQPGEDETLQWAPVPGQKVEVPA